MIAPGEPSRPATVYDANATLLADAVRELGGEPVPLGIIGDDPEALAAALDRGLASADMVLLSGGTSKGSGDVSFRVLARRSPGIVVHGVALKPGKPICLGAVGGTPVAILPGFPTSAIFTFHEFIAPVLQVLAGRREALSREIEARLSVRCNSERGRTEYLLVALVPGTGGRWADGLPAGERVGLGHHVQPGRWLHRYPQAPGVHRPRRKSEGDSAGAGVEPADLVVIGSHCIGLDMLLGLLAARGYRSKTLWVGSQGGFGAATRGDCDVAGVHLLDPETDTYNAPFLPAGVRLLAGYGRLQGLVYRPGDPRFEGQSLETAIDNACAGTSCLFVNRNRGSGTRILIDGLLRGRRPAGYAVEVRSHNAVAAAIAQGRADCGLAIEPVARLYHLGFTPSRHEQYDFAIPADRWDRPAVAAFRAA